MKGLLDDQFFVRPPDGDKQTVPILISEIEILLRD